jgi:beta-lactamase regulating signal transducer with metallopeptidase domain
MTEFLGTIETSQLGYRLGWTLLHTLWLGLGVAIAFVVAMRLLRRRSANVRYLVSCGMLLVMVLLTASVFSLVTPTNPANPADGRSLGSSETWFDRATTWTGMLIARTIKSRTPDAQAGASVPASNLPSPVGRISATPRPEHLARGLEPVLPWIVSAWTVGVILFSTWRMYGWIAAQWLRYLAVRPVGQKMRQAVETLRRSMRVRAPVKVVESMLVGVPTVVGWLRPVILLPIGLVTGLTPQQLQAILAHELAHIRRYDYLANLLQSLAETLLFYHPAVWLISRRIRTEREHCCDDLAVAAGAEVFCYAESLLAVARRSAVAPRHLAVAVALAATDKPSRLRRRILRLLGGGDSRGGDRSTWSIAGVILAAVLASACLLGNACSRLAWQTQPPTTQPTTMAAATGGSLQPGQSTSMPATPRPTEPAAQTAQPAAQGPTYDAITLPEGQLAYMSVSPRIALQAYRYHTWSFSKPPANCGTTHPQATVAVSSGKLLKFAVAIDADDPQATEPTVLRINASGKSDFHEAQTIPIAPSEEKKQGYKRYTVGPGVVQLQVDGQTVPVTIRGLYDRYTSGHRFLNLGLDCTLQGYCRFGDHKLAVRVSDGDGNGRIGDAVRPIVRNGRVAGRTPGDTVNIDLGDGAFDANSQTIRAMYGQPVYIDGAWWDVQVAADRKTVSARKLENLATGWVKIDNPYWEALCIGDTYVFWQTYNPAVQAFPMPPGKYTVIRYKQWTNTAKKEAQGAILIEPSFADRNGPFLLKGKEPAFEVQAGQTLSLPIGTPLQPKLKATGGGEDRRVKFSCRILDASQSSPQYILLANGKSPQITLVVLNPAETKSATTMPAKPAFVKMSSQDGALQFTGWWTAPADAHGPFTAVVNLNCGSFSCVMESTTFGGGTSTAPATGTPGK